MKLEITQPIFTIKQPSTGRDLHFRRYLVREKKILLFAKESKEVNEIFRAVKTVIKNCCSDDVNIDKIPLFDLEYIYLQLRAKSVNNVETLTVQDKDDGLNYDMKIDFEAIDVVFPENAPDRNIKVGDVTIVMRYPEAAIYDDADLKTNLFKEGLFKLVVTCVDKVFKGDELIEMNEKEVEEFLDSLDIPTYTKIEEFLLTMPSIKYEISYDNSVGTKKIIAFSSLVDFFLYL